MLQLLCQVPGGQLEQVGCSGGDAWTGTVDKKAAGPSRARTRAQHGVYAAAPLIAAHCHVKLGTRGRFNVDAAGTAALAVAPAGT